MKYLLIGGGPASVSASATLHRVDTSGEITILTMERHRPYAKMVLPYLISDDVEEKHMYLYLPQGVDIVYDQEVVKIDHSEKQVETASGRHFTYDKLLIATGGVPERLHVEGGDLPFVFTIRNLGDVIGIKNRLNGKKGRAIIAGAGPVSMETGDALYKLGLDITFVVSSNRIFSTLMDLEAATFMEKQLREKGIEIRKGEDIIKVEKDGTVCFKSGDKQPSSLVIIGKGVKPCIAFLEGSGIKTKRGIIVDEHQETNLPGIFAAGDVAETYDIVYGDKRVNALWPAAYEQGTIAALNMASIPTAYQGSLARNILRVFGISVLSAGMARADSPEVHTNVGHDYFRKIILEDGILKGLIFVGDVKNEGLYASLMKRRIDVSAFSDSILRGTYSYPRFMRSVINKSLK